jgi:aspartyl-tRNA(Asn)/glutamyl-tRNA(Gln) amidotransferase subunit A
MDVVSATALVRRCIDAAERHGPALGAVITPMHEQALEDARRADEVAAEGRWLGVLHGMPVSVKDSFATAGVRTTLGSAIYRDHVPRRDGEVVRRLRDAGAVLVAKDNMHEFASGQTTQNPHFGSCRNPWDTDRVPGGSSGGSAAAVAAGMTLGAVGTDAGGSVRTPAALCGISGLRPTFGAISLWNDGLPDIIDFSVAGPMARRVTDVARLYAALAGHDPRDPRSEPGARPEVLTGLSDTVDRVRIGVPSGGLLEAAAPDVAAAVRAAVEVLASLGARVEVLAVPGIDEVDGHFRTLRTAQGAAVLEHAYVTSPELLGEDVRSLVRAGLAVTGAQYARALEFQKRLRHDVRAMFASVDVVVSPTTPVTAANLDAPVWWLPDEGHLSRVWPMAGTPSLSVPCGFDGLGLPIGLELAGAWWSEPLLFRLGAAYQRATDWHLRIPAGFGSPNGDASMPA